MQRIKISIPRAGCCPGAAPFREQQGEGWGHSRTRCYLCIPERDRSHCWSPQCISEQLRIRSRSEASCKSWEGAARPCIPSFQGSKSPCSLSCPVGRCPPSSSAGPVSVRQIWGELSQKGLLALPGVMGPQVPGGKMLSTSLVLETLPI